ncbi:MAG: hypothetical protein AAGF74_15050 [Pseudomonadota bacterium]
MRSLFSPLFGAILLAGCTEFPELDAAVSDAARRAPYPELAPVEDILVDPTPTRLGDEADEDYLKWRAQRLRQKARALRGAVVSDVTRAELAAAKQRAEELRPERAEAEETPADPATVTPVAPPLPEVEPTDLLEL